MKPCFYCKKDFEPKKEKAKYCSTNCRVLAYQKRVRNGESFNGGISMKAKIDIIYNLLQESQLIKKTEEQPFKQKLINNSGGNDELYSEEKQNIKDKGWFIKNAPDAYDGEEVIRSFRNEIQNSIGLTARERSELLLALDSGNLLKY